jgi:hypothetical protein
VKTFHALCLLCVLAACADSGPIKVGKDSYSITTRVAFTGAASAQANAMTEASQYCTTLHKEMVIHTVSNNECAIHGGCGEAYIQFLCVDAIDPRYLNANEPNLKLHQ